MAPPPNLECSIWPPQNYFPDSVRATVRVAEEKRGPAARTCVEMHAHPIDPLKDRVSESSLSRARTLRVRESWVEL